MCGYVGHDGVMTSVGLSHNQLPMNINSVMFRVEVLTMQKFQMVSATLLFHLQQFKQRTQQIATAEPSAKAQGHVHSDAVEYVNPAADGEGTLANNRGFSIGKYYRNRKGKTELRIFLFRIFHEEYLLNSQEYIIIYHASSFKTQYIVNLSHDFLRQVAYLRNKLLYLHICI